MKSDISWYRTNIRYQDGIGTALTFIVGLFKDLNLMLPEYKTCSRACWVCPHQASFNIRLAQHCYCTAWIHSNHICTRWSFQMFCAVASSATKHTYSRSECFCDSCPPLEPEAWARPPDWLRHSRCGCAPAGPGGLAPTGPFGETNRFRQHVTCIFGRCCCRRRVLSEREKDGHTSITPGMDLRGVRAPWRNRTWTSLSS